jgi:hypothetical protein
MFDTSSVFAGAAVDFEATTFKIGLTELAVDDELLVLVLFVSSHLMLTLTMHENRSKLMLNLRRLKVAIF